MARESDQPDTNAMRARPFTILLVDDDQDCRSIMRDAFDEVSGSHRIIELENGKDAIDYLLDSDESIRPDLIFLDLEMPRMGGLEVLEMAKSHPRLKSIPVIVLSGVSDCDVIERALMLGANSYTVKQNRIEEFIAAVSASATYWLTMHQYPRKALQQKLASM